MKRIVCYYLAISMIPLNKSSELSCIEEPQLIVKESYCDYSNMTRLSMYTLNKDPKLSLAKSAPHVGCNIDFDEQFHINDTFYIECDTEMSCPDEELKEVRRNVYYLECDEMDTFINETAISTVIYESSTEAEVFETETTTPLLDVLNASRIDVTSMKTTVTLPRLEILSSTEAEVFETETNTPLLDVLNASRIDVTSTKTTVNLPRLEILSSTEAEVFQTERTKLLNVKNFTRTSEDITTLNPNAEILNNKTALVIAVKDATEKSNDSTNVLVILGYSLAALGTTVGIAFGAYKLKSKMQSGSYLFPETPTAPGFIELA